MKPLKKKLVLRVKRSDLRFLDLRVSRRSRRAFFNADSSFQADSLGSVSIRPNNQLDTVCGGKGAEPIHFCFFVGEGICSGRRPRDGPSARRVHRFWQECVRHHSVGECSLEWHSKGESTNGSTILFSLSEQTETLVLRAVCTYF